MSRHEPPEGWHPGYNCDPPRGNRCYCYGDCMYAGSRWRIDLVDAQAGTVHLYRDLSGSRREAIVVAESRVASVEWHESLGCEHSALKNMVDQFRVSQQETPTENT